MSNDSVIYPLSDAPMRHDGSNHDSKQTVNRLLQTALDTHQKRENVYGGKTQQNVFEDTAIIANVVLRKDLNSKDIAFIFLAMKLARYGNIMELLEYFQDNLDEVVKLNASADDSILDGIVYLALTERERVK